MHVVFDHERNSALWLRLKTYWEGRLQLLRTQNDAVMDDGKRNLQVGRIAEIKAMLDLDREQPTAAPEEAPRV